MRLDVRVLAIAALGMVATAMPAWAEFQITSGMQADLDRLKTVIAGWAAAPAVVKAVIEQNAHGPLDGMDTAKWKLASQRSSHWSHD